MARYEAGETLSSIARTYDCSPPAISYIVSRSRAGQGKAPSPPPSTSGTEPQLVKAAATGSSANSPSDAAAPATQPPLADGPTLRDERRAWPEATAGGTAERRDELRLREVNGVAGSHAASRPGGFPTPMPPRQPSPPLPPASANGDARRRLHLSLGAPPSGGSAAPAAEPHPGEHTDTANGQPARPADGAERGALAANREPHDGRVAAEPEHHGGAPIGQYGPARPRNGDGAEHRAGGGSFIDKELRARVDGDIAAFLAAFDAALGDDTQENRALLREATDRLLRAGARTRIELERLEARVPLPPRDGGQRPGPAWRDR